jgi:hypothetical protein
LSRLAPASPASVSCRGTRMYASAIRVAIMTEIPSAAAAWPLLILSHRNSSYTAMRSSVERICLLSARACSPIIAGLPSPSHLAGPANKPVDQGIAGWAASAAIMPELARLMHRIHNPAAPMPDGPRPTAFHAVSFLNAYCVIYSGVARQHDGASHRRSERNARYREMMLRHAIEDSHDRAHKLATSKTPPV